MYVFSTLNWIFKFLKSAWVLSMFVRTGPLFWSYESTIRLWIWFVWTIKESFFNHNIQRLKAWRLLKKLSKRLKFFENVNKQSELFRIETWKEWQKQWTPNPNWTFKKLKLLQEMQPNWHLHVPIQIGFNMVFHYHGKEYLIASPPTNMKNWMG
jgi:hypothetical protein